MPGAPEAPAWGQAPGWVAPPKAPRSRLRKIVIGLVVAVVAFFALAIVVSIINPSHRGEVVFSTTGQTATDNCKVANQVSSIKAGDSVYVMVVWSHTMSSSEKVIEEDFKDGVSLGTLNWDSSNYAGYDCTSSAHDFKDTFTQPGTYEIKLTVGSEVVADGKLTVTP